MEYEKKTHKNGLHILEQLCTFWSKFAHFGAKFCTFWSNLLQKTAHFSKSEIGNPKIGKKKNNTPKP